MSTNVILYKNSAEPERLDKTDYLTSSVSYSGTFKGVVSSTDPVIELTGDNYATVFDKNYAFVSAFNRYYFIKKAEIVSTGLYRIYLHVDVLMSWKAKILATEAFVERNEESYNTFLQDNSIPMQAGPTYTVISFPNQPFSNSASSEIWNTALTVLRAADNNTSNEEEVAGNE